MKFKVGDRVVWTSQSNGKHLTKVGVVVAVLPPEITPMSPRYRKLRESHKTWAYGGHRDEESYLVSSPERRGYNQPILYWPAASVLRHESEASTLNKVGFVGAREGLTALQRSSLLDLLVRLGPAELHQGDELGGDARAHALARELGWRTVAHPAGLTTYRAFTQVDEVLPVVSDALVRYRRLVDAVAVLIACPAEMSEKWSNLWRIVRLARKRGLPLYIILPDGTIQTENDER